MARKSLEGILRKQALDSLMCGTEWITNHLQLFVPTDAKAPSQLKAATELAMFYGYTIGWSHPEIRKQLTVIRQFLVELFADPAPAHWLRRFPCYYMQYALGYLALRAGGERISGFEEAISYVHKDGYPSNIEQTPYREIASQYSVWKAGFSVERPTFGSVVRRTVLGRNVNPVYLSAAEVYSITHTLLYLADFSGPCPDMTEADRSRTVNLVETLLVHYWRKPDWDIAGELLLNLIGLDKWNTALFEEAYSALLTMRRRDGTIPGPQFASNSDVYSQQQIFDGCYHTTLVAMFLCSAYLYRTKSCDE